MECIMATNKEKKEEVGLIGHIIEENSTNLQ